MARNDTKDREIVVSRLIDAPRELVWKAFSDPKHIVHWWGPNGFTNTIHEIAFKPGGIWKMTMHGPDGTDYPNYSVFQEIVAPERISYWHGSDAEDSRHFFATIQLDEEVGKTRVTLRLLFETVEACEKVKAFGAVEGGQQTLAKLDAYVAKMAAA